MYAIRSYYETWWGDEITPAMFKSELFSDKGDITIWLNSPGGDCIAASQIYAMLMDYPVITSYSIHYTKLYEKKRTPFSNYSQIGGVSI